jgi:uncharacterized protein involved in outer membrane biogenesis
MKEIKPKEFIEQVLINEVGEIYENHPYIAFAIISIGIEFLGKCLNNKEDWNFKGRSKTDFEFAINTLNSFSKYRNLNYNLQDSLRNGFLHSFTPKENITLSSKNQQSHLTVDLDDKLNLNCENFYLDFKNGCKEIISMNHFNSNKMDLPLIYIPSLNSEISITGKTH